MPKFPRDIRQADAVTAFRRRGGVERRGKGSHRVVNMPNGVNLSVPSGIVKVGLLRSLIRSAELTDEEFLESLRR
jgi:predicted RNA binding protein YcfA (HicA-like mRNA interferase family)